MPTIEVNDEQILRCLEQLTPAGRRAALLKLIRGLEQVDRLVERNRVKLETLCRERGAQFSQLTEDGREALVDKILHEPC